MKDKLQNAFKPAPERFRYAVDTAVKDALEQSQSASDKKHLSVKWRVFIAAVLITALIPSAVFGATKLYGLFARPVDNYGLEIGIEPDQKADYPEYVKMHVTIPEGFSAMSPEADNMKFYSVSASEKYTDGFSLYPMRFDNAADMKGYIGNVENCEEKTVDGHQAYEVKMISSTWSRLYVYYEDVNVFLLIYHSNVTDEQLTDFVKGITFTEGTADDYTELYTPVDERPQTQVKYTDNEQYTAYPLDTKLTFVDHPYTYDESVYYSAQISNIRTLDNISELDETCFSDAFGKYEIADNNGYLHPRTVNTIKEGDGFSDTDELIKSEIKNQVMVLADITYQNLSSEDIELYVPYRINVYNHDGEGKYTQANIIDLDNKIYTTDLCDSEITYISPHGTGKSFYILNLPANETTTVTIGSRVDTDMLDKAYFTLFGVSDVVDPAHDGKGYQTNYLFKVLDDDR